MRVTATEKGITIYGKTYKVKNTLANIIWIVLRAIWKY